MMQVLCMGYVCVYECVRGWVCRCKRMCVCVSVGLGVCMFVYVILIGNNPYTSLYHTHTPTHIHIYIHTIQQGILVRKQAIRVSIEWSPSFPSFSFKIECVRGV